MVTTQFGVVQIGRTTQIFSDSITFDEDWAYEQVAIFKNAGDGYKYGIVTRTVTTTDWEEVTLAEQ